MRHLLVGLAFCAAATVTLRADVIDITSDGTPIMGVNSSVNSSLGTPAQQDSNPSTPVYITDGNLATHEQVFGSFAYAGVVGLGSATTNASVTGLTVSFELFYDGGWFGPNGQDSLDQEEKASVGTTQAPITAADISILPTMQITTDGTTWTNVAYTSTDYDSNLEGVYHYNPALVAPITFTLDTPVNNIEGIRLIGETGGTSDFLGIAEMNVIAETPEPSTYALLGAGLVALIAFGRWRRLA